MGATDSLLQVDGVTKQFGALTAVDDVSFEIEESGTMVALIGPNGAGKTTMFNLISAVHSTTSGSVRFNGEEITDRPVHEIAKLGLTRTFQDTRVLGRMTIRENLLVASQVSTATEERADELLEMVELADKADQLARDISFGQQKLVSICQTLMLEPELVLLDEPFAGVNPNMENKILDVIHTFLDEGVNFFLIEHDLDLVMENCADILVMDAGELITRGSPTEIQNNEQVVEAYFGDDV